LLLANSIYYASTGDGLVLPIVDVRHPAFEVRTTEAELAAMADQYVREAGGRTQQTTPELLEALKRSRLGRGLMAAANGVLGGIETYMMKVGPGNLPPDVHPLDRAIAASFPALTTRLRLQETAQLLAEGLAGMLPGLPGRPIVCLNIGGGAGADSWNALMLLQAAHPGLVANRPATIAILDVDAAGAAFGEKAVEALQASGGPLSAMTVRVHHATYDWSDASRLPAILQALPADAVCAASSEGALFEYGTDIQIVENLRALRAASPAAATFVGTVTRDSAATRASRASTRVTTIPRSIEAFRNLASAAGWRLGFVSERPFAYSVRLEPI
jgi:hypothetical protein